MVSVLIAALQNVGVSCPSLQTCIAHGSSSSSSSSMSTSGGGCTVGLGEGMVL
jgi:hypothetical protein